MTRLAWVLLVVVPLLGCSVERLGADAECIRNSECQDVLVCAGGRCRPACEQDRDCDMGLICVPAGSFGLNACLPPDAPALCAVNSDCPSDAICVDGRCRAECIADLDCSVGTRCDLETSSCEVPIDRAPDAGPPPDGATSECPDAGFLCGTTCQDLFTDRANCGGCGVRCPDNEICENAVCVCTDPFSMCGLGCFNFNTNSEFCGGCHVRCNGPCNEATCCGPGRMSCGGTCIPILDDSANCGSCGNECPAAHSCIAGACIVDNDVCEGAEEVSLSSAAAVEIMGSTGGASPSFRSCLIGRDVFYAFTLTRRELVWLEVTGSNSAAGFLNGDCSTVGLRCPGLLCPRSDPTTGGDAWAVLESGRHLIVVDATRGTRDAAPFTLTIHHLPVGELDPAPIAAGSFDRMGTLGVSGDTPGSCSDGADRAHFFVTCPGDMAGTLTADTCATAGLDTVLGHASSLAPVATCNLDGTCAPGAELSISVPAEPALHLVYVESQATGTGGAYRFSGTRP